MYHLHVLLWSPLTLYLDEDDGDSTISPQWYAIEVYESDDKRNEGIITVVRKTSRRQSHVIEYFMGKRK